ncbi:DUF2970 domain-containing protein [Trinickia mobilis]|uniref:DUF2970 domain-containing protein n=1 Tax=Trinickia mobilis TaxID=2816356 RepID=UPI001A8F94E7|nr:DUF2970 domain-containing protein [Trinickia mobilis]
MIFLRMLRIVFWSFFGVRKAASHEADMASVKPVFLPLVAVGLAVCFASLLICIAILASTAGR